MVCIYCGAKTSVTNSRLQRRNNQVWRRRQCPDCHAVFTTHEAIDLSQTLRVEKEGVLEPFQPDLLFSELLHALSHRKDPYTASREVTATIISRLLSAASKPTYSSRQISWETAGVLKRFDRRAYLRFLAEHPSLEA